MLDLLSHLLIIGLATAVEPVQVLTFIAVLSSTHGVRSGWAFLAGWLTSLLTVAFLTWVAAARISEYASDGTQRRGGRQATLSVEVVVGFCLLLYALYRVRRRPGPVNPSRLGAPGATLTTTHAAVVGLLIPPWPLIIAGAADVLRSDVGVTRSSSPWCCSSPLPRRRSRQCSGGQYDRRNPRWIILRVCGHGWNPTQSISSRSSPCSSVFGCSCTAFDAGERWTERNPPTTLPSFGRSRSQSGNSSVSMVCWAAVVYRDPAMVLRLISAPSCSHRALDGSQSERAMFSSR